jgi:hypothetical protein
MYKGVPRGALPELKRLGEEILQRPEVRVELRGTFLLPESIRDRGEERASSESDVQVVDFTIFVDIHLFLLLEKRAD